MSRTDRHRARGFTLMESMFASVVLALGVVAIATTTTASYSQERFAEERRQGTELAQQLMEQISGMPIDPPIAGAPAIKNYNGFTDTVRTGDMPTTVSTTSTTPDPSAAATTFVRRVAVQRFDSLSTANATTGQLALVTIDVTTPLGQTVRLRKLIVPVRVS
ncbi:MAG: prepilin-type N-terminal cleavage/methylation domain-containing protein [Tepidisphaeraceae bacterium]